MQLASSPLPHLPLWGSAFGAAAPAASAAQSSSTPPRPPFSPVHGTHFCLVTRETEAPLFAPQSRRSRFKSRCLEPPKGWQRVGGRKVGRGVRGWSCVVGAGCGLFAESYCRRGGWRGRRGSEEGGLPNTLFLSQLCPTHALPQAFSNDDFAFPGCSFRAPMLLEGWQAVAQPGCICLIACFEALIITA